MSRSKRLKKPPDRSKTGTTRKCVATGEVRSTAEMVRFVCDPAGVLAPDLAGRLPGRGAWASASREAIVKAVRDGLLNRTLKTNARLPEGRSAEEVADAIARGLRERCLDAAGLARRAGAAKLGFDMAFEALGKQKAAALLIAADASDDGAAKLIRVAGDAAVVRLFTTEEQSRAFGRDKVVYAAIDSGPAAERFLREAARLEGMETSAGAPALESAL